MNKVCIIVGVVLVCLYLFSTGVCAQDREPGTQELLKKIEELEERVRRLDEEARARKRLEVTEEELEEREREI
ncbi:MAG: hypothetical protein RRA35_03255, partial [Desulfomonilia bacterium]|nr:hypothetical protein [Desulfomonilia bacterium]